MPLLEVENLRKSFGGLAAVDGVTLALEPGELRAIAAETGLTLPVVEQDVDLVATLVDTVAFMTNGAIVEAGAVGDLAADPATGPAARHLSL